MSHYNRNLGQEEEKPVGKHRGIKGTMAGYAMLSLMFLTGLIGGATLSEDNKWSGIALYPVVALIGGLLLFLYEKKRSRK